MGRPKLLLPWGKTNILGHLVEQWTVIGSAQIAVVIEENSHVANAANQFATLERIINPAPEQGMFSSVQCAARWSGWRQLVTHFVITLGDQPQVGIDTLQAIINFARHNASYICQPARNGRGRHPVVLPCGYFFELAAAREGNLKEFLRAREAARRLLEMDDEGLDLDLDTMADYEQALRLKASD